MPASVLEDGKLAAKEEAMQRAFDELARTDVQFAGVEEANRTEDQREHPTVGLEKFKTTTDVSFFKAAGGSAEELLNCFLAGVLEPELATEDFHGALAFKAFMNLATTEYRPAISAERIAMELRANGYWSTSSSAAECHLDVDPVDIATTLFTDEQAPAVNAASQRGADVLKDDGNPHNFGQNVDPNLDLVGELTNIDVSEVTGLYVQFDAEAQYPGDGPDVRPDDFTYDAEQIVEYVECPQKTKGSIWRR